MDTQVIAAIIGVVGTVGAVILGWLLRNRATPKSPSSKEVPSHVPGVNKASKEITSSEAHTLEVEVNHEELDFLKALLIFVKPETELSDSYSSIISRQYDQLLIEVKKLEKKQDWQTLLSVKRILREYFEYSGKYLDGVEFGRMYVLALEQMGQAEEAIWTSVKHVGYLLVLAGRHELARKKLKESLEMLAPRPQTSSTCECYFYCYRYLGISYQRDDIAGDANVAAEYFQKAKGYIDFFKHNERKQKELYARLLGNLGNIALEKQNYSEALGNYQESHNLFLELDDQEHIGISKLKIAETYISSEEGIDHAAGFLDAANLIFIEMGWLEGEARVAEQYARIYEYKARKARALKDQYIENSMNAAKRSEALFRRIGLERSVGRIEELKNRLIASSARMDRHKQTQ